MDSEFFKFKTNHPFSNITLLFTTSRTSRPWVVFIPFTLQAYPHILHVSFESSYQCMIPILSLCCCFSLTPHYFHIQTRYSYPRMCWFSKATSLFLFGRTKFLLLFPTESLLLFHLIVRFVLLFTIDFLASLLAYTILDLTSRYHMENWLGLFCALIEQGCRISPPSRLFLLLGFFPSEGVHFEKESTPFA